MLGLVHIDYAYYISDEYNLTRLGLVFGNIGLEAWTHQRCAFDVANLEEENNGKTTIYLSMYLDDKNIKLYAFLDPAEKQIFESIIKINGFGPNKALSILNAFTSDEIRVITRNSDIASFNTIKGISESTAKALIKGLKTYFGR